ncbi:hypothetical protein CPB86DRAFT_733697 [Serendipita vermifera]|nr:hypothetical protein CPB86DRAFT_733697 [Serendipita vermifera]
MKDRGIPFMDIITPLGALIALYDTLEVTRFLWRKRRTLHQDISEGNVMVREGEAVAIPEDLRTELEGMCFATALLGEGGPNPKADRLETPLLLIDFDLAEKMKLTSGEESSDPTGTPYFMARTVRTPEIEEGLHLFNPMPQLSAGAARYEQYNEERLQTFKPTERIWKYLDDSKPLEPFRHKLRYDAESVFWLLLWWCMLAKPSVDQNTDDFLPEYWWRQFTDGFDSDPPYDPRVWFISGDRDIEKVLHAEYKPLGLLLRKMAGQLKGNPEVLDDPDVRKHDEYLHESFQRLIFDFLSEHFKANSKFLTLKKSSRRRRVVDEFKRPPPITQSTHSQNVSDSGPLKRPREYTDEDDSQEKFSPNKRLKV